MIRSSKCRSNARIAVPLLGHESPIQQRYRRWRNQGDRRRRPYPIPTSTRCLSVCFVSYLALPVVRQTWCPVDAMKRGRSAHCSPSRAVPCLPRFVAAAIWEEGAESDDEAGARIFWGAVFFPRRRSLLRGRCTSDVRVFRLHGTQTDVGSTHRPTSCLPTRSVKYRKPSSACVLHRTTSLFSTTSKTQC
jgi:hypothetical protein